jgi:hypothetical protein
MGIDDLKRALQGLDEPTFCEGTVQLTERLAIMLPDGDLAAPDDPAFVDWLVEHGEPAPFGQAGETKLDPAVRNATRLVARGAARIGGFDPEDILGTIEAALSPRTHLVATLSDVLVYRLGGHFAQHKDTPASADLIGTLIVEVPIEHRGGAFRIEDNEAHVVDWSGPVDPKALRWVAMFSDVDHAIEPVQEGARVTLVYSLSLSDWPRDDPGRRARMAAVSASANSLQLDTGPLMIACTRHVIALDGPQPQGIETLRGADRDVADAFASSGFSVAVRTCVAARYVEDDPERSHKFTPDGEVFYARLDRPLLDHEVAALLDCVVFEGMTGDGGGYADDDASSLAPWIADTVGPERWVFRTTAAATFLRACDFADDGFIGNGAVGSHLYKLAALEVKRR